MLSGYKTKICAGLIALTGIASQIGSVTPNQLWAAFFLSVAGALYSLRVALEKNANPLEKKK